jgi:hypothetical protein
VADQVVLHQVAFSESEIEELFEVRIGQQRDLARQQTLNLRARSDRGDLIINIYSVYLNPPMNTPSIAAGLDGDEIGIVGASPTIDSGYKVL